MPNDKKAGINLHPFDVLDLEPAGRLIFTPCPGTKGVSLRESVEQLKQAGSVAILTLMMPDEMARNNVENLPAICEENNLLWFHLPIEDDQAPAQLFEDRWLGAKSRIMDLLQSGKTLAIHCKGGTGRTGLMAAIILMHSGVQRAEAVKRVQAVRPRSLTLEPHQAYINRLSSE